jgi:glutaminyl-tRNA synthetase
MADEIKSNFIREIIDLDIEQVKNDGRVHTRFPPEPNGYLHIGHAKSICLNFGLANDYEGAKCNLRFDDTNPAKEEDEYVNSIIEDVKWLGFNTENILYASDYFEKMYMYAVQLIQQDKAYIDDQTPDEISESRGSLKSPGTESPFRNRTVKENLQLFKDMRGGKFQNEEKVLRAKIDMSSPNLNFRDPIMYRILHESHHRTGDTWCIYPMYDWAHGLEDSIEEITHSICTLEFQDHRPLYDWFLDQLDVHHPQQIEFARLNLSYTILSKRMLKQLVEESHVSGWDDPRMPTISGFRRKGYSPESIRELCDRVGVARRDGIIDIALLENCVRKDLNKSSQRVMAVLDPLKVVITNYPENQVENLEADNNPENEADGKRIISFSRELWIEKSDFMEDAPKKFFRLSERREVRLKHAYYITCNKVIKNENDEVVELHCSYDPKTKGGWSDDGRRVKGTLHWVSIPHAVDAEIHQYEHLFNVENPNKPKEGISFTDNINPNSLHIINGCKLESSLKNAKLGNYFQFLRNGYYCLDKDSTLNGLIFNRTATLRDTWGKKNK